MTTAMGPAPTTPDTPPPDARLAADIVDCDLASSTTFLPSVPHAAFDVDTPEDLARLEAAPAQ